MMEKTKLPCGVCGELLEVQLQPKPRIVNLETISLIMVEHSAQVGCKCGATLLPVIMAVGTVGIHLAPVQPQQQSLIVPPGVGTPGRF